MLVRAAYHVFCGVDLVFPCLFAVVFALNHHLFPAIAITGILSRWMRSLRAGGGLALGLALLVAVVVVERGFEAGVDATFCKADGLERSSPAPHFLSVGLNRPGEGQIHLGGLSRYWATSVLGGASRAEAAERTRKVILADWKENWIEVPSFLAKKMVWAWQSDDTPFYYAMYQIWERTGDRHSACKKEIHLTSASADSFSVSETYMWMNEVRQSIQTSAFIWYFVTMIFGAVGVIWHMRKNR